MCKELTWSVIFDEFNDRCSNMLFICNEITWNVILFELNMTGAIKMVAISEIFGVT